MTTPPYGLESLSYPIIIATHNGKLIHSNSEGTRLLQGGGEGPIWSEIARQVFTTRFPDDTVQPVRIGNAFHLAHKSRRPSPIHDHPIVVLSILPSTLFSILDDIPAGLYSIGEDRAHFKYLNRFAAELFGYDSVEDLLTATAGSVRQLYSSEKEYRELLRNLDREHQVINFPLLMKKKHGGPITILVAVREIMHGETRLRRDGVFTHIPDYDKSQMLVDLPTAAYEVTYQQDGAGRPIPLISYCNNEFCRMFGFTAPADVVNKVDISTLYADPSDAAKFEDDLRDAARHGPPLRGRFIRVRRVDDGGEFWIAVNCNLRGAPETPQGRRGTITDITTMVMTGGLVDVQRVRAIIHSFLAPVYSLQGIVSFIQTEALRSYLRGPLGDEDGHDVLDWCWAADIHERLRDVSYIVETFDALLSALIHELIEFLGEGGKALDATVAARIRELRKQLEAYQLRAIETTDMSPRTFFIQAREPVLNVERFLTEPKVKRALEGLGSAAHIWARIGEVLGRLDSLYTLYLATVARSEIAMTLLETGSLREYLLKDRTNEEKVDLRREDLERLILQEIYAFGPEAASKGLEIRLRFSGPTYVSCSARLVCRMLGYLLDNAVKYSFDREGFIAVSCSERAQYAVLAIDNYGVGMTENEIQSGQLLRFGARGSLAWDRNREGSGIGLTEVRRIAGLHGGRVNLESKAVASAGPITKETPHKNRVLVTLRVDGGKRQ